MGRLKTLNDWLSYQENIHSSEIDLGLERVQKVYQKLFPKGVEFKVITVAGTNGKGSTIAFIDSIYQHATINVAKFTSPHIVDYNERFVINGKPATDAQICHAFDEIEQARGNTSLTYFEFSTLAALLIFTKEKVDIALLEVGLGGRLDSVNVVDSDVALITNIAIDHIDYLGDTREVIGFEKAGIMRKNRPCICADNQPPTSIQQQADNIGAKLEFITTRYLGEVGLCGLHQQQNAALAIKAVAALQTILPVSRLAVQVGIKSTMIDARLQIKIIGNKTFVLDVAHNPASVQVLADELAKHQQPTLAIFSAMNDKDITSMIDCMRPIVDKWLLLSLDNKRAIQMQNLTNLFALGDNIQGCENMQKALKLALSDINYSRIVVFGSFYLIAEMLIQIQNCKYDVKDRC